MRGRRPNLNVTLLERAELARRAADWGRRREAKRARVILLLSQGASWGEVMAKLRCSRAFIARWVARFRRGRIGGMYALHQGSRPRVKAGLRRWILAAMTEHTAAGGEVWSTRRLAERFKVSHMTIHRLWRDRGPPRQQ